MRLYLQAITDRIYFLNFHKLTLTNNKDASRESCCVYWIKSANFSSVTWAHQKEQQIYCSAKPGVSQKFRYSFMLHNISYLQISLFCGLLSICSKSLAKELCKMSNNLESSFINLNTFSIIHQHNQIFRATKDYFQRFVHCTWIFFLLFFFFTKMTAINASYRKSRWLNSIWNFFVQSSLLSVNSGRMKWGYRII